MRLLHAHERHDKLHMTRRPGYSERVKVGYDRMCNCQPQTSMSRALSSTLSSHPLILAAAPASVWQLVDRDRRADLVSTLDEHREDVPRPLATEMGSRGALLVSRGVSSSKMATRH